MKQIQRFYIIEAGHGFSITVLDSKLEEFVVVLSIYF
jgi:hypothetical protein